MACHFYSVFHFVCVFYLNVVADIDVQDTDLPWAAVILLMLHENILVADGFNSLEAVIRWFASPERVLYHALSRAVRATLTPLFQIALGVVVKRIFGLNVECPAAGASQLSVLRRYINSVLLSQEVLQRAFRILGPHYEIVSVRHFTSLVQALLTFDPDYFPCDGSQGR